MWAPFPEQLYEFICEWLDLPGWAPVNKMLDMSSLVLYTRPKLVVELGVFGGKSLFPMAYAIRSNGIGRIVAVDPYTNEDAIAGVLLTDHQEWWKSVNLYEIKCRVFKDAEKYEIDTVIEWVIETSLKASSRFNLNTIDILHIDANHSEEFALSDVKTYLPLVTQNGYIWLDDTDWPSVQSAIDYISDKCTLIKDYGKFRLYQKSL